MAYDSLEFAPLLGGATQIAVVLGNPQTGPSSIMLRFSPGSPRIMHSHAAGYYAVVGNGASKDWVQVADVATAPSQTPRDYWYQAGWQVHQDGFQVTRLQRFT